MNRKQVVIIAFSALFLFSLLFGVQFVRLAGANFSHYVPDPKPAFTILSDGSVDPPTAPIQRNGEIYTLTDDVPGYCIVVKRDNVTLDGGGYTLQGNGTSTYGTSTGVFIRNRTNVTVTQMEIRDYNYGIKLREQSAGTEIIGNTITANRVSIYLGTSSHNSIHGNTITQNNEGIHIVYPGTNSIVGNTITNNTEYGVYLEETDDNIISENYIAENGHGILVNDSSYNRIIGNTIKENNKWAIRLEDHDAKNISNIIYHNYFIDNNVGREGLQVSIPGLYLGIDDWRPGNPNVWDDGERGNYWSDYFTRYPNATEIYNTGVGDTGFHINPNNIDYHPVMRDNVIPEFPKWTPLLIMLFSFTVIAVICRHSLHKANHRRRMK